MRWVLCHSKAGDIVFRAALAPLALVATLLAISADEARAHDDTSATLHAKFRPLHKAAEVGDLDSVNHFIAVHMADVDLVFSDDTPLHLAARNGHVSIVATLIAAGAWVNAGRGFKPLHEAARFGHIPVVSVLIAAGAWVNTNAGFGTPLHYAANVTVVSMLVAAGADVNRNGNGDRTPLHHAKSASVVSALVAAGADVNANANGHFGTPLNHLSRYAGNASVVLVLLDAGADVNGSGGPMPLNGAASWGRVPIVLVLLAAGADVNGKHGGRTPLQSAASGGQVTVVSVLIAAGADVNANAGLGTPLHYAAYSGHIPVVSALLAAKADVNTKTTSRGGFNVGAGSTPLHLAARYGKVTVVSTLLAAGATVNVKNDDDHTPLHYASRSGATYASVISVLIAAGGHWGTSCAGTGFPNPAGPKPPCLSGVRFCQDLEPSQFYSPTLSACSPYDECLAAGDCALSRDVCRRGFDPDRFYDLETGECVPFVECHPTATVSRHNECECPSWRRYARPDGSCVSSCDRAETVVGYQCECTADTATNVNGACELLYPCHDSAVRKADNSGCECPTGTFAHGDPSGGYHRSRSYDRYGERPIIPDSAICHAGHASIPHNLHDWRSAIYANNPTLIAHFISGHEQDPDENHMLHLAAYGGYYLAAKTLIERGANVTLKRYGYGETPLHPAVRNRRTKLITLLLRRGADASAKDSDGDTALHLAARRPDAAENAGLIAFLLDAGADPNVRNDDGWRPLDLAYHGGTPGDLIWQARRGMMAALIAGGATWSDECTSGAIPNENYRPSSGIADCVCPLHISERDSRGRCECPAHSHAQVNGRCLPKDSAQVEAEILKMETELLRLRTVLASLNLQLSLAVEAPREMVEEIAMRADETAQEIKRRRDNFLALARADLAGAPPPPVAMSDTAAECRMLGGEVQIHSATGIRVCSRIDANDTFCLVDSGDAYPCRGLFRHVRTCNDDYNRPALNPFFCGPKCGERSAVGDECE